MKGESVCLAGLVMMKMLPVRSQFSTFGQLFFATAALELVPALKLPILFPN